LGEIKRMICIGDVQFFIAMQGVDDSEAPIVNDSPDMYFQHRFFDPFSTVWLPSTLAVSDVMSAYHRQGTISFKSQRRISSALRKTWL